MILPAMRLVRQTSPMLLIAGTTVIAFAVTAPELFLDAGLFAARNLLLISPVVAFGLVLTAAITASGSMGLIASAFHGREALIIIASSFVGALTPVCGLTVLPLVAGLLTAGVPLAPIMAFWLSSPITDPGMLAVTAGTLGWSFALMKTAAAFAAGLLGGGATFVLTRSGFFQNPARTSRLTSHLIGNTCSDCGPARIEWRFWKEPERRTVFRRTVLRTGRLMVLWLTAAFMAEFFMNLYLPENAVASVAGSDQPWAVPIAAFVGAPIYLDGYAALPLIRGLMDAGMRTDAALTFLIAGGITSAWAAIPVFALVRKPVFALYLFLALAVSMTAGWVSGMVLA